jgi:hypothetical protein
MFRADAHFVIGAAHLREGSPCQDYALADNDGRTPFAVISDGCSASVSASGRMGNTDIGARLWCLAARQEVPYFDYSTNQELLNYVAKRTARLARPLWCADEDLDATMGFVGSFGDGLRAFLAGDGVIAWKCKDRVDTAIVKWVANMPGYPSYYLDSPRIKQFAQQSESAAREAGISPYKIERYVQGALVSTSESAALNGLAGFSMTLPDNTDIAAVMSDGITQFSGITTHQAVSALLDIGTARAGHFAKRQLNGLIRRSAKAGRTAQDDVAVAMLCRV